MTILDRLDELRNEARRLGIDEEVHTWDVVEAIMAYAELLGYDIYLALDPDEELTREDLTANL